MVSLSVGHINGVPLTVSTIRALERTPAKPSYRYVRFEFDRAEKTASGSGEGAAFVSHLHVAARREYLALPAEIQRLNWDSWEPCFKN